MITFTLDFTNWQDYLPYWILIGSLTLNMISLVYAYESADKMERNPMSFVLLFLLMLISGPFFYLIHVFLLRGNNVKG